MQGKSDLFRNSGSSGRGSAEGETAEDVMMISEYQCLKQPDAVMPETEFGIPLDTDRISCNSVDAYLGKCQIMGMPSVESLCHFKEEGGGEGMLPHMVNMMEMDEVIRSCMSLSEHQNIIKGSLTNLICPEKHLSGNHNWDKLSNRKPYFQFQPTIFTNKSRFPEKEPREGDLNMELHSFLHRPSQPNLRAIPSRMESFGKKPSNPKYKYSCLAKNPGLNNFTMTSDLSPSLSLLTLRTTNASPVVSETGLDFTKIASPPVDVLDDAEI